MPARISDSPSRFVVTYDIGTTGSKTCVYEIGKELVLRAHEMEHYDLTIGTKGEAEQDPEAWWRAMCRSTPRALASAGIAASDIAGISFCSQMQGLVLVDKDGRALRPAMSYMDQRASTQKERLSGRGPRIAGMGVFRLLRWLAVAGGVAASVKDPVWKYLWVKENEPSVYSRIHKWLDVKEYVVARCTGRFVMTADSAYATFLVDARKGNSVWSLSLMKGLGVDPDHLPPIVASTSIVGGLTPSAARELGLLAGTHVIAGGGDASLIGIGAGAVSEGASHIYVGTSGWLSTVTSRRIVDAGTMMASIVGAIDGMYNYFGEQETSGKCLEWVRDHLALDEIGVYLKKAEIPSGPESEFKSLIDYLCTTVESVPAGARGVVFTPWLHGSRCPFEDPYARGVFFNIGLDTGKRALIRAVVEGIAFNKRLLLDAQEQKVKVSGTIRFVGGGALSDVLCGILADVLNRTVEAVEEPQCAGAAGAALTAAVGLGLLPSVGEAGNLVRVRAVYKPRAEHREVYERNYSVFRNLYAANKTFFRTLNTHTGM